MEKNKYGLDFFQQFLGKDFQFRKGQLEIINYLYGEYEKNPKGSVLLELPTGAGKSLIGFCFSLLMNHHNRNGYIIPSDLSLQKQYENDLIRYRLLWGSIKGVDNYDCSINGLRFSLGDCQIRRLSYEKCKELPCYSTCGYFSARDKAKASSTSILNYSFWLLQMNYVLQKMGPMAPFENRDFTIFDEAHKIEDIVQNHFAPFFKKSDKDRLLKLDRFLQERPLHNYRIDLAEWERIFDHLYWKKELNSDNLKIAETFILKILSWGETWKEEIKKLYEGKIIPKDINSIFSILDWCKDIHCKLEDYNKIIELYPESLIKTLDGKNESMKFFTTEESYIIDKHLLQQSGFKVFMSATIGDPKNYANIIGLKEFSFVRMNSDFNFEKSPIYVFSKFRMSYKEKDQSFPKLIEIMDRILERHKGQRGIIHSGSYQLTDKIVSGSRNSNRILNYENSKEKEEALNRHSLIDDSVLIGPSLSTGISLDDDLARFQIIFKVPYPALTDELVKARMNKNKNWYKWKTTIEILQQLGRSNRHKDDWSVTYIIDGCFLDIWKNNTFPKWLNNRFVFI